MIFLYIWLNLLTIRRVLSGSCLPYSNDEWDFFTTFIITICFYLYLFKFSPIRILKPLIIGYWPFMYLMKIQLNSQLCHFSVLIFLITRAPCQLLNQLNGKNF